MRTFDETNSEYSLEKDLSDINDFLLPELKFRQNILEYLFSNLRLWAWQISTTILLFTSFGLLLQLHQITTNTYASGFKTDLHAITNQITLEEVVFENEIILSETGHLIRVPGDGPQYVGEPSGAIDDAWRNLLTGLNLNLRGAEADDIRDKTYQWPESDVFFSGIDMFHSLHCLNELRKLLYPDYYAEQNITEADQRIANIHKEHCLDYIRQSLQCGGDLTPMNWAWMNGTKTVIFKPGTPHTCRKFDPIWEWVLERKTYWDSPENMNINHKSKGS